MNEKFLHYVWKLQYFDKKELKTASGDIVHIIHPGTLNTDSGPDFLNAKIKIGDVTWFGNVEIHTRSSDWKLHQHADDSAYNNVIVHVVYINDQPARRDNGSLLPVIELKNRILEDLLLNYKTIENSREEIPCSAHLPVVEKVHRFNMMERALLEKLENKSLLVKDLLIKNNHDWQETIYQLLARNFGFKINSDPFLKLAQRVPLKALLKQRDSLFKIESILFGQSGLLGESFKDEYPNALIREYQFQSNKLNLEFRRMESCEWKFLRVRPANFPSIRIAEFAALIYSCPDFLTSLFDFQSFKTVREELVKIKTSSYWQTHYLFDVISVGKKNQGLGEESFRNIVINTIVPVLFTYGKLNDNTGLIERALHFLEHIPAESNRITRLWSGAGITAQNAFDSQGLLEMYHSWCIKKNCLRCEIGSQVVMGDKQGKAAMHSN